MIQRLRIICQQLLKTQLVDKTTFKNLSSACVKESYVIIPLGIIFTAEVSSQKVKAVLVEYSCILLHSVRPPQSA